MSRVKLFIKFSLICCIIIICIIFIGIETLNLKLCIAKNTSMQPTISNNDLLIIKQYDDYGVGDIIQFKHNNLTITHRIVDKVVDNNQIVYYTLGDNDNTLKKVYLSSVVGKVIKTFDNVGVVCNYINYFIVIVFVVGSTFVFKKLIKYDYN